MAGFLGYQLTAGEKDRITEKCSFQFMKDNEELFEMSPTNMCSVRSGQFLASGKANRHQDVTPAVRDRILDYCRQSLRDNDYPAHQFYPDLVAPAAVGVESVQSVIPRVSVANTESVYLTAETLSTLSRTNSNFRSWILQNLTLRSLRSNYPLSKSSANSVALR